MLKNYQQSSSLLLLKSSEVDKVQVIIDRVTKELEDSEFEDDLCCEVVIQRKPEHEHNAIWFHSKGTLDITHVERIAKAVIEELEIDRPFFCSWSYHCSERVIDEFGGGAFVVRKGLDTVWVNAMSYVRDIAYGEEQPKEFEDD